MTGHRAGLPPSLLLLLAVTCCAEALSVGDRVRRQVVVTTPTPAAVVTTPTAAAATGSGGDGGMSPMELITIAALGGAAVLLAVLVCYCNGWCCAGCGSRGTMEDQLEIPVDVNKKRQKFVYRTLKQTPQKAGSTPVTAFTVIDNSAYESRRTPKEGVKRRSSAIDAFANLEDGLKANFGSMTDHSVHRKNPLFDAGALNAAFGTDADEEEGFGGFGDDDSLTGEGEGNLEGFGFGNDDPSKPKTPAPVVEAFAGFSGVVGAGGGQFSTHRSGKSSRSTATGAISPGIGDAGEPASIGIEAAVLGADFSGAGNPSTMAELMYTPGYINKWYMAEYRKTIPDAADNMVELEMALDQAADLFKEADTEGRGELTFDQVEGVLMGSGSFVAGQDLKDLFVRVDLDCNGTLRYREFVNLKAIEEGHLTEPLVDETEPWISAKDNKLVAPPGSVFDPKHLKKFCKAKPGLFKHEKRGKIRLSASLQKQHAGTALKIELLEAVHLLAESSLVVCKIIPSSKELKAQKSIVRTGTTHPVYSAAFAWTVYDSTVHSGRLVVTVLDAKSKKPLGMTSFRLADIANDEIDTEGWFNLTTERVGLVDNFRFVKPIEGSARVAGRLSAFAVSRRSTKNMRKLMKVTPPAGIDELTPLKLLGKGSFGRVVSATNKVGNTFAVKAIEKYPLLSNEGYSTIMTERRVLSARGACLFISHLFSSFQSSTHLFLVLEIIHGGELGEHLSSQVRESDAAFYLAEILIGLWHLHDNRIIYRDLKLENVLLDARGHVKLSDFGLAKDGMGDGDKARTLCGTPEYVAPEMISQTPYDKSVDFWALGVLFYRMVAGKFPFDGAQDRVDPATDQPIVYTAILAGVVDHPAHMSTHAVSLVEGLLKPNPADRLGCNNQRGHEELQKHAFLSSIDWKKAITRKLKPPSRPSIKSVSAQDVSGDDSPFELITGGTKEQRAQMSQSAFVGFDWTQAELELNQ